MNLHIQTGCSCTVFSCTWSFQNEPLDLALQYGALPRLVVHVQQALLFGSERIFSDERCGGECRLVGFVNLLDLVQIERPVAACGEDGERAGGR